MSKTIKSFLVGIGLDTKDWEKGSKEVTTGLSRFRSLAGFAGTAVAGSMAAIGGSALAAGQRIDKLVLSTEKFSASSKFIYDYGNALRTLGGSADEAIGAVSSIDKALDELRLKGQFGAFSEAAFSRADVGALSRAANAEEFLRISSEIVPTLNKEQQRLFQESFGFSDAVMRSLREGPEKLDAMIIRAGELADGFTGAVEASREFNKELTEFQLRLEGIANALSGPIQQGFTGIFSSINKFLDNNKAAVDTVTKMAESSPTGAALATAGATATAGGVALTGIGLKGAGAALTRAGPYGLAIGAGMMAWDTRPEDIEALTGGRWKPSSYIFDKTPLDAIQDAWEWAKSKTWWGSDEKESYSDIYGGIVSGTVEPMDAVNATPDMVMINSQPAPAATVAPKVQNNLNIKLEMDGREIETKVVDVIERREQETIDAMQSTVVR